MKSNVCPLCKSNHDPLMFIAEHWLLDEIAREHPEWTSSDGICQKCVDYYRGLTDAVQVIDDRGPQ
jgi:hypothetical protein